MDVDVGVCADVLGVSTASDYPCAIADRDGTRARAPVLGDPEGSELTEARRPLAADNPSGLRGSRRCGDRSLRRHRAGYSDAQSGGCVAKPIEMKLKALPVLPAGRKELREACRRLVAAHQAVQALFDNLTELREAKKDEGAKLARLGHAESDLLRAGIVFAAAGLEASIKQVVQHALHPIVKRHEPARKRRGDYVSKPVDESPGAVKAALAGKDIEAALDRHYIESFTTASLQSERALKKVRDALGISATGAFTNAHLGALRTFFDVRNQIAHELDLKPSAGVGDSTRRTRTLGQSLAYCDDALALAAAYILAAEDLLEPTLVKP